MSLLSRIGLGTAQFGLDYGVTNHRGRCSEREVAVILEEAVARGVGYLDTAAGYGDAEAVVGRHLPVGHRLRVVTKTAAVVENAISTKHKTLWLDAIERACERLRVGQLYGVLIHRADDLRKSGAEHLVEALREAQARGWVARIGASIYSAEDLALVETRFRPELVQLPVNVLDRRLVQAEVLRHFEEIGSEVHARSVFLQGILLMEPAKLPEYFAPIRHHVATLHRRWRVNGLSVVAGCLAAVLQVPAIHVAIVGVTSVAEFSDLLTALKHVADNWVDTIDLGAIDPGCLDPRQWPAMR